MIQQLKKLGIPTYFHAIAKRYFQLEILNDEKVPYARDGNVMFVMNHTAFFGLEVYLFGSFLHARDTELDFRTLVWKGFAEGPMGPWFRAMGCATASIGTGAKLLRDGKTVLILPEGVDATDVRQKFNTFHSGFLRMIKEHPVPIIPIGFTGVDEAIPWWVTENPLLAEKFMKPVNPAFDFFMMPKLPTLRPTKVVFKVGDPIHLSADDLATEEKLKNQVSNVRGVIEGLVADAEVHRAASINRSPLNSAFHRLVEGKITHI